MKSLPASWTIAAGNAPSAVNRFHRSMARFAADTAMKPWRCVAHRAWPLSQRMPTDMSAAKRPKRKCFRFINYSVPARQRNLSTPNEPAMKTPAPKAETTTNKPHDHRPPEQLDKRMIDPATGRPIARAPFVFLNHLLSARPPEEVALVFNRIKERVRRIDLTKTSKLADPTVLQMAMSRLGDIS